MNLDAFHSFTEHCMAVLLAVNCCKHVVCYIGAQFFVQKHVFYVQKLIFGRFGNIWFWVIFFGPRLKLAFSRLTTSIEKIPLIDRSHHGESKKYRFDAQLPVDQKLSQLLVLFKSR